MDVRAGLKEYWKGLRLNPAQMEAWLENVFKGARDAKKRAYAADEPARNARAEALAAEEQERAEALALAARAATAEQALADACVEIKFRTPHA